MFILSHIGNKGSTIFSLPWLPAEFISVKRASLSDSAAELLCLLIGEQTCMAAESQTGLHNWKGKTSLSSDSVCNLILLSFPNAHAPVF